MPGIRKALKQCSHCARMQCQAPGCFAARGAYACALKRPSINDQFVMQGPRCLFAGCAYAWDLQGPSNNDQLDCQKCLESCRKCICLGFARLLNTTISLSATMLCKAPAYVLQDVLNRTLQVPSHQPQAVPQI